MIVIIIIAYTCICKKKKQIHQKREMTRVYPVSIIGNWEVIESAPVVPVVVSDGGGNFPVVISDGGGNFPVAINDPL